MLYSRSRYLKTECNISNLFCAVLTFKIKCQKTQSTKKNFLKAYCVPAVPAWPFSVPSWPSTYVHNELAHTIPD